MKRGLEFMIQIDNTWKWDKTSKLNGRKPKVKLTKGGNTYIFKYGSCNFESYAEAIAEQLGKQVGIDMAHYELAQAGDIYGVLTDYFVSDGERFISSKELVDIVNNQLKNDGITLSLKGNTIANICQSLGYLYPANDVKLIERQLYLRWAFCGLIAESDKNSTNIGFIIDTEGKLRLSPDYDNSTMALLDSNINKYIESLRCGIDIYSIIDGIKNDLHPISSDDKLFGDEFREFCSLYPVYADEILKSLSKCDVEAAIEEVQRINEVEIPWEISYWVTKALKARLDDMTSFYDTKGNDNYQKVMSSSSSRKY